MSDWENNAARLINELGLMVSMAGNFARGKQRSTIDQ